MATPTHRAPDVWALVRAQHGVIARIQLLALGLTPAAIRQRRLNGRLHEVHRGIYAVGRRELDRHGELMAAVLACGSEAQLSHQSAAELWRMRGRVDGPDDVAVSGDVPRRRPGITTIGADIIVAGTYIASQSAIRSPFSSIWRPSSLRTKSKTRSTRPIGST